MVHRPAAIDCVQTTYCSLRESGPNDLLPQYFQVFPPTTILFRLRGFRACTPITDLPIASRGTEQLGPLFLKAYTAVEPTPLIMKIRSHWIEPNWFFVPRIAIRPIAIKF